MRTTARFWLVGATVCLVAVSAQAIGFYVQKDLSLYGYLNQHDVDDDWGSVACAPTAAVNSFVYLENKYPGIYDDWLVPGSDYQAMVSAARTLALNYMNTSLPSGTTAEDFLLGKMKFIENALPGWTRYEAQLAGTWDSTNFYGEDKPGWVELTYPTWEFLFLELEACEDVEIGLAYDAGGGHALTLTSFHWTDDGTPFVIDLGEAYIDFIDPLTGAYGTANIWQTSLDGPILTSYGGGATITMAVSESPIPEPLTMLCVFASVAGVGAYIRRRRMV